MAAAVKVVRKVLPLAQLRRDARLQMRERMDENHTLTLVAVLDRGAKLDAVRVKYDGTAYWLTDGFHRVAAHEHLGRTEIECEVTRGDFDDAVIDAAGSNTEEKLKRSNVDKRRAIEALLANAKCADWSNRRIADHAGVSEGSVRNARGDAPSAPAQVTQVKGAAPTSRKGRDGKTYQSNGQRDAGKLRAFNNTLEKMRAATTLHELDAAYGQLASILGEGAEWVKRADAASQLRHDRGRELAALAAAPAPVTRHEKPEAEPAEEEQPMPQVVSFVPSVPAAPSGVSLQKQQENAAAFVKRCAAFERDALKLLNETPIATLRDAASRAECEHAIKRLRVLLNELTAAPAAESAA